MMFALWYFPWQKCMHKLGKFVSTRLFDIVWNPTARGQILSFCRSNEMHCNRWPTFFLFRLSCVNLQGENVEQIIWACLLFVEIVGPAERAAVLIWWNGINILYHHILFPWKPVLDIVLCGENHSEFDIWQMRGIQLPPVQTNKCAQGWLCYQPEGSCPSMLYYR